MVKNSNKLCIENIKVLENNLVGIYKIQNLVNNKVYVGQSVDIKNRLFYHIRNTELHTDLKIYNAINKYGLNNFVFSIVCLINIENRSNEQIKKELNILEVLYIEIYNSYIEGYNSTLGGDSGRLGYKHTQETILKMKNSAKGRIPKIAKIVMKNVYAYDVIDHIYYDAISIAEMSRKTDCDYRSISQICNNIKGRFISKKRFLFSFSIENLKERIKIHESGIREKNKFDRISKLGKSNIDKKYNKSNKNGS